MHGQQNIKIFPYGRFKLCPVIRETFQLPCLFEERHMTTY